MIALPVVGGAVGYAVGVVVAMARHGLDADGLGAVFGGAALGAGAGLAAAAWIVR